MVATFSNRIDTTFTRLREEGRGGFMAYLCAGDPNLESTRALALGLASVGVDVLELGVPFSDPLADGVVNQMAAQRALEAGTTLRGVLDTVRAIRAGCETPIVLYTYLNPIFQYGGERFVRDAVDAGVDGVLMLDLPPGEMAEMGEQLQAGGLHPIRLVAPTTPEERLDGIVSSGGGFIYYVSRAGVTGEQVAVSEGIAEGVAAIRRHTNLPVAVGFGISNPEQSAAVSLLADAVVVGSAIVRRIAEYGSAPDLVERVTGFVGPLVEAAHRRTSTTGARVAAG